ncbi:MAG: sensor histidine kinase, partial [Yoonia sp.]|nr:sensor histidine kinase [Yoonia sp.]
GTPLSACLKIPMICASLNRAVFIKNLLRYLAEKILLLNTTNFRGDYPITIGERDVLTLLSALISNAIKHHDKDFGAIHISAQTAEDKCVIQISDDGPGIPEGYSEQVFEAMTTLKSRDEIEGSGMGLAIVRKIANFYNGHVELRRDLNDAGTTMQIWF